MPRPTSPSWQSVLERSIQLPGERQRLVTALGINPMTLNRWVKAETQPNRNHLIDLLRYVQPQFPHQLGMAITLVQCMPPGKDGKIHSLRERMGRGTPPWIADLENLSIFLAMESLAGFVVQYQRPASIEDISKETLLPAYQTDNEV